jgi:hypothetical protein
MISRRTILGRALALLAIPFMPKVARKVTPDRRWTSEHLALINAELRQNQLAAAERFEAKRIARILGDNNELLQDVVWPEGTRCPQFSMLPGAINYYDRDGNLIPPTTRISEIA